MTHSPIVKPPIPVETFITIGKKRGFGTESAKLLVQLVVNCKMNLYT